MSETIDARVAVLEQIAKDTRDALIGIRSDMKDMRTEIKAHIEAVRTEIKADIEAVRTEIKADIGGIRIEIKGLRSEARGDFRWLLGLIIALAGATFASGLALLAAMAKGFHWV